MKKRIFFGVILLFLLWMEVMIALYVKDGFVRFYLGDILVVLVLYFAVRTVVPERFPFLPVGIFMFSAGIECLQGVHFVERLGLAQNPFWSVALGGTFDARDLACYGVGTLVLLIYEWVRA